MDKPLIFDFDVCHILSAPPDAKKAEGMKVRRVARVVSHWNAEGQRWEYEAPQGISDLYEQAKPDQPKGM